MQIRNRGTEEVPFGFVYSDDGEGRAWFTIEGSTLSIGGSGSGYFRALTGRELVDAQAKLIERYGAKEEVDV